VNTVDCVVIGAGVIGLAVARALAVAGREVIILERERHVGMHMSSRNSEVIHAGMHYPTGSLKALLCVSGRERLYRYCDERGIAYRRCGKFIVATSHSQLAQLHAIESQARANGVVDLEWLDGAQARRFEPELSCHAALSSPSTGIIDSHGYMLSLLADAESAGAQIAYGAAVCALRPSQGGVDICIEPEPLPVLRARLLVNSAGLGAHHVARLIEGFPAELIPEVRYAKGNYFSLSGAAPFGRLIYPMPESAGLGIHMTLDLAGRARFGPDVEWVDELNYDIDSARAADFYAAIRGYWPRLAEGRLLPAYAGIRPKLLAREGQADFCMSGPAEHGVAGVVNLFGMESPGLTASLAIGAHVAGNWLIQCAASD
jgi:L-2-hydroxyglutarate oxidase LhgO